MTNPFKRFFSGLHKTVHFIFGRTEWGSSGSLRESEIIGQIAHAIGNNVGKLSPQVIRRDAKGTTFKRDHLAQLLSLRPCPDCTTFDFLYRVGTDLVYTSNFFAIIFYNDDFTQVERIQPVTAISPRIFEDDDGNAFLRFTWAYDNKEYTVPYGAVIHIKSRYNRMRFLGTAPDADLQNTVDLLQTTYDGIKNVIKNSASLRGYLQYNNFIDDNELKEKVKEFKEAYMSAENEGGIAGLGQDYTFKEITQQPRQVPVTQIATLSSNLYRYYGVNENILTASFKEDDWNAFYEETIEPIAIQLSLECTFKLLTERERGFGNVIIFPANRLQYASLTTRSTIGKDMLDRGSMTRNEYREMMYMPPVEGGDEFIVSLNYVKVADMSLYQTGRDSGAEETPEENPPNNSRAALIAQIKEVCNQNANRKED